MKDRVEILLHEYDGVYSEVRQSIALQYTVLGLGFAFLGLMTKELIAAYQQNHYLISGVLGLGLCMVDVFLVFAWVGELSRMRRGSVYLSWIEADLRNCFETSSDLKSFGFHSWLLSGPKTPQLKLPYFVTFCLFVILGFAGSVFSIWLGSKQNLGRLFFSFGIATGVIVVIAFCSALVCLIWINRWPIRGMKEDANNNDAANGIKAEVGGLDRG